MFIANAYCLLIYFTLVLHCSESFTRGREDFANEKYWPQSNSELSVLCGRKCISLLMEQWPLPFCRNDCLTMVKVKTMCGEITFQTEPLSALEIPTFTFFSLTKAAHLRLCQCGTFPV